MIAMALALEPALIIADEPTTALDVTTQAQILALLKELQGMHGTAVMFITHDFGVVAEVADRVVVMRDGKLIESGVTGDVLRDPKADYTKALVAAVPSLHPRHASTPDRPAPALALKGLNKIYGGRASLVGGRGRRVHAVRDVDLEVPRGHSVALVGESGSGKSTLARCVVGLEKADGGDILLGGENIAGFSRKQLKPYRHLVQMVFQDPFASLNPRHRVGDIIALGPTLRGTPRRAAWDRARELLDMVGLQPEAAARYPHEFSGGQAPAHRHRPGARDGARADPRRRAGVGARRVRAEAGAGPARRASPVARALDALHHPRPAGRGARMRRESPSGGTGRSWSEDRPRRSSRTPTTSTPASS